MGLPKTVTSTAGRILRDVKALGISAPLRAAYEASKRSNFHTVLFREVDPAKAPRSVPLSLGAHVPSGMTARARCLGDAQQIVDEGTRVFGWRARTGSQGPWSLDPLVDECWPETTPWWQIDIRTEARLSDVKFVWEAGRHRDLVVLARAAVLEADGPWMDRLTEMLDRWVAECRPEQGVHWYSSLELALRAIAWAQVLALVGNRVDPRLRAQLDHQLMASARHIMVELPYTVSSMKNNHLLGDGLGLVVLGMLFPGKNGDRWRRVGDRLMLAQLRRHMRSDGSMIEDSLSYHRFVLEMFVVRELLGNAPAEMTDALRSAALHLVRLGVLEGEVPQFGDWDEGRVLADSGPAGSTSGTALLALALSGYAVPAGAWDEYDELAWYAAEGADGSTAIPQMKGTWQRAGDFVRVRTGELSVWFKTGGAQSHQHADLSSVWARTGSTWLLEDPGTGTYNGPLEIRNGFRTSAAHPVWCPAGEDQLQPHRAFRWLRRATGWSSYAGHVGDVTAFLAAHDAFASSAGSVARLILVGPRGFTVVDAVERAGGDWTMTLPLGPDARAQSFFGVEGATSHWGEQSPWLGWRSETYGSWEESEWLVLREKLAGQRRWGFGQAIEAEVDFRWRRGSVEAHVALGTDRIRLTTGGGAG